MASGWAEIDGTWYYLRTSGAMDTGWVNQGGTCYYLDGSGAMQTGWHWIGNAWYYLDAETGAMASGWAEIDGTCYYLSTSGAMETGWLNQGGTCYYLAGSGAMHDRLAYHRRFLVLPEHRVWRHGHRIRLLSTTCDTTWAAPATCNTLSGYLLLRI